MTKTSKKTKKTLKARLASWVMCSPISVWSLLFIIVPIVLLAFMSFMTKGALGRVVYKFTFENYTDILEPVYFNVIKESLSIAFFSTLFTVLLGYPLAAYIATRSSQKGGILTVLLMLPYWVSGLVILYSFVILMNTDGIINHILQFLHLTKDSVQILYTDGAVITGMVYMFMPFAVLPMYSSIEKLDTALIEASHDLGAGPVRTFFKVILPLTAPGIFAAVILTFIPSVGYYMVTDMLGGGTSMLIGKLIYNQFTISRNWPFGAALSMILAIVIFFMLFIYKKLGGNLDDLGA